MMGFHVGMAVGRGIMVFIYLRIFFEVIELQVKLLDCYPVPWYADGVPPMIVYLLLMLFGVFLFDGDDE